MGSGIGGGGAGGGVVVVVMILLAGVVVVVVVVVVVPVVVAKCWCRWCLQLLRYSKLNFGFWESTLKNEK